jgi:phosphomevalonate kinase
MTVISAPGKVLIAGGYLVLDQKYSGLVVAATSRFYAAIENGQGNESSWNLIRVKSPQFLNARWKYDVVIQQDGSLEVSQRTGDE